MDIKQSKRIVIKIGSALLVDDETGQLRQTWFDSLIADVARVRNDGKEVLIVSSGSIALGRQYFKTSKGQLSIADEQAAAAIGQIQLAHAYQTALKEHQYHVAQILLTLDDTENRQRYLNAKHTLERLLKAGIIPVINENDTVATSEICFGDNDRLAARVAQMVSADVLVLLSDIDGLYTADPNKDPNATRISTVTEMTDDIRKMGGDSASYVGSGGMITKLAAAEIVMSSGCNMCLTSGHLDSPLYQLEQGAPCTWFIPNTTPIKARKNWLRQHLKISGTLNIDEGAVHALKQGKSLLPVGVKQLSGEFQQGDAVMILDSQGNQVALGLVNYACTDAKRIIGKQSDEIKIELGYCLHYEMVHRDDLVML